MKFKTGNNKEREEKMKGGIHEKKEEEEDKDGISLVNNYQIMKQLWK